MTGWLKRWNHKRLYHRREKRERERVMASHAALSAAGRSEADALLLRLAPVDCGIVLTRIGPEADGGYLLPDALDGIQALYSPGVSETTGFDLEIARLGIDCHLADGSIDAPENLHPRITFEKAMIGPAVDPGYTTMPDWVGRRGPQKGDLLLQMDIEGAEYDVISSMPDELLRRFRIIVLEMHEIVDLLLSERNKLDCFLSRLERSHLICHLHPNNAQAALPFGERLVPRLLEMTLIRRDVCVSGKTQQYPHPLDRRNIPYLPEIVPEHFWSIPA